MAGIEAIGEVPLNEGWQFEFGLTQKNLATRKPEAATPATGYSAWWSATQDGDEIAASLKTDLAEATGQPGDVFGYITPAAVKAGLTAKLGQVVWEVLQKPDGRVSRPYTVVTIRSV